MRLREGPLRIKIAAGPDELAELRARMEKQGVTLVDQSEEAEYVAIPAPVPGSASQLRLAQRPSLSARELEILEYLADGWSNAEIASSLRIGVRTVRFHIEGINAKLGTSRRGEAVREGVRMGLVSFET